jgi:molybdate-binding protein/DNA-binding XRE family transcriptional regulator
MGEPCRNRVRERREARGLTQIVLADQARLTRQSVSAIEAGRAVPSVDVALRIARALDCQVEEIFAGPAAETVIDAEPAAAQGRGRRVSMAHIGGRWVSLPLAGEGLRLSADGIVAGAGAGRVQVEPVRSPSEVRENVVVMGCAGALGLLCDRLNSRAGAGRFLWFPASSCAALEALGRRRTHVAGVHLVDARTGEANVPDVRRAVPDQTLVLVTLARWQAGLVTRPEDAARIRSVEDLGRRGVRLIAREAGAGAQRLLERELHRVGVPIEAARGARLKASGHFDMARAVAMGAADAGIATRDAAAAFALRFVPLAEERYDLVLSTELLADPRIERLFDVLVSAAFRRELDCLGYDVSSAGTRVAELRVA